MAKRFSRLIDPDSIAFPMRASSKWEAIEELVALLAARGKVTCTSELVEATLKRESQGSTGIGQGIAVPHAKCEAVRELSVCLGLAQPALEWEAIDGKPCDVIFLMAAPPGASGPHIQSLASLARLLKATSLYDRILRATSAHEAYQALIEEENSLLADSE